MILSALLPSSAIKCDMREAFKNTILWICFGKGGGGSKFIYLCPLLVHFNFIWCTDTIYNSEIFPGPQNSFWKMNGVGLSSRRSASWSLSWPGWKTTRRWEDLNMASWPFLLESCPGELEYSYSLLSHQQNQIIDIIAASLFVLNWLNWQYQKTRSK